MWFILRNHGHKKMNTCTHSDFYSIPRQNYHSINYYCFVTDGTDSTLPLCNAFIWSFSIIVVLYSWHCEIFPAMAAKYEHKIKIIIHNVRVITMFNSIFGKSSCLPNSTSPFSPVYKLQGDAFAINHWTLNRKMCTRYEVCCPHCLTVSYSYTVSCGQAECSSSERSLDPLHCYVPLVRN